jgi:hypothetical protein
LPQSVVGSPEIRHSLRVCSDLSDRFDAISEKAKAAGANLRSAGDKTRERLQSQATEARERADAAADRFYDKVDAVEDTADARSMRCTHGPTPSR